MTGGGNLLTGISWPGKAIQHHVALSFIAQVGPFDHGWIVDTVGRIPHVHLLDLSVEEDLLVVGSAKLDQGMRSDEVALTYHLPGQCFSIELQGEDPRLRCPGDADLLPLLVEIWDSEALRRTAYVDRVPTRAIRALNRLDQDFLVLVFGGIGEEGLSG